MEKFGWFLIIISMLFVSIQGELANNDGRRPTMEDRISRMELPRGLGWAGRRGPRDTEYQEEMPVIDNSTETNVTAQLGDSAFLNCKVKNLHIYPVSWVDIPNMNILTLGLDTFVQDDRFRIVRTKDSEDWILQIRRVQKSDEGRYECHVSTGLETLVRQFNLRVVVPKADILGPEKIHVSEGRSVTLVCVIKDSSTSPGRIMWSHNDKIGILTTEGDSEGMHRVVESADERRSELVILKAAPRNSGNYSCRTLHSKPDTVQLIVSTGNDGDDIIAFQSHGIPVNKPCVLLLLLALFIVRSGSCGGPFSGNGTNDL